jgi:hypothetical protein
MTEPAPGAAAATVLIELRLRYAHGLGGLAPYFAGLERGVAMATRCRGCGRTWFAPRLSCPCGGRELDWVELTGRGTIVTLTRGRAVLPGTGNAGEFTFALIQLDGADNRCFGRLGGASSQPGPGSAVRLSRAEGDWAHPAQCAEYVPDAD